MPMVKNALIHTVQIAITSINCVRLSLIYKREGNTLKWLPSFLYIIVLNINRKFDCKIKNLIDCSFQNRFLKSQFCVCFFVYTNDFFRLNYFYNFLNGGYICMTRCVNIYNIAE